VPIDVLDPSILRFFQHARMRRACRFSNNMFDSGDLSKHLQSIRVHNGKSPKSGAFGEGFDEKRGGRFEFNFGLLELGELWWVLDLGTSGLLSHLPQDLGHLARNLGGTGEDNRTVSRLEDTRVLLDGDQGSEGLDGFEFTILLVVDDISRRDLLVLGNTLDGKTNRVTRSGRSKNFLVLFDRENLLSLEVGWDKSNCVTGSKSSLFDGSADNLTYTLNVVDVGNRKTKGGIGLTCGGDDKVVESIDNGVSGDLFLGDLVGSPSLVP
jgi:hypothetical protein